VICLEAPRSGAFEANALLGGPRRLAVRAVKSAVGAFIGAQRRLLTEGADGLGAVFRQEGQYGAGTYRRWDARKVSCNHRNEHPVFGRSNEIFPLKHNIQFACRDYRKNSSEETNSAAAVSGGAANSPSTAEPLGFEDFWCYDAT
jgi:hypothetical protein